MPVRALHLLSFANGMAPGRAPVGRVPVGGVPAGGVPPELAALEAPPGFALEAVALLKTAQPINRSTAAMLSAPPHETAHAISRESPTSTRKISEACKSAAGTQNTARYGSGLRMTAGKIIAACAKIMDITKPKKTECSVAS